MDGLGYRFGQVLLGLDNWPWRVVAATDLDRDSRLDLVWRHAGHGAVAVWFVRGGELLAGVQVDASASDMNWQIG